MTTSEQIRDILDKADVYVTNRAPRKGTGTYDRADVIRAAQVVELQRIADSLEIMVSHGRHL